MLDGRIDSQGTIAELKARGVLDDIAHDAETDAKASESVMASSDITDVESAAADISTGSVKEVGNTKKPRALVKEEHQETGAVKWSIYKTYLVS